MAETNAGKKIGAKAIAGKIKGVALIPAIKVLRSQRQAALDVLDENCHSYLDEQKIFPSNWYSEDDLMSLLHALATILPPRPDIWEFFGHDGATQDFQNIYSAFIRPNRPEFVFSRYSNIWRLYHDNGGVRVRCAPDRADLEISAYLVRQREFCRLQVGHFTALAELSGAQDIRVELLRTADESGPARWRCSWRLP